MKRFIFNALFTFLILECTLNAQELVVPQSDQYTKYKFIKRNGSIIIGEIIEKTVAKPYKIKLDNGVIIEISEPEIYRMKPLLTSQAAKQLDPFTTPVYKWAYGAEVIGMSNGRLNIGTPGISTGLSMSAHRFLGYHLAVGAGAGVYNYDLDNRRMLMPVYGDIKWRLIKNFNTPVIQFRGGYSFAAKSYINGLRDKNGGMFINPFVGYEFGVNNRVGWTMGFGMVVQKAFYAYSEGTTFADEDIIFRRTEFKIAISIH